MLLFYWKLGLVFDFYQNVLDYRYVEGEDLSFEHERFLDMILHYVEKKSTIES